MTFAEKIYIEIYKTRPINTSTYSREWLGQCRSYYTSIKSRNIEASNECLINLIEKLLEQQAVMQSNPQKLLQAVARKYSSLADQVALEISRRSYNSYKISERTQKILLTSAEKILAKKEHHEVMPILILK